MKFLTVFRNIDISYNNFSEISEPSTCQDHFNYFQSTSGHENSSVVNEPLESISIDLGFSGNTLAEDQMHYSSLLTLVSVWKNTNCIIQIATCLRIMGALLVGIPVKDIAGWWRVCFWVSTIPDTILALAMIFCAESPSWLYKQGKATEAEVEFEKLFGVVHVKVAMTEMAKLDRGDDIDSVKISELLSGPHFRVVFIGSTLFALQQVSGINAVFYFSSTIFKKAGVPSSLANVFIGIVNLTGKRNQHAFCAGWERNSCWGKCNSQRVL
ncbi:probable plastidic glucose transporter 2 [Humulus lupulus]|uniref:probable plastidic glucose transporter 2 n=1 Tax=Humulus lupulus TaxID=3486 RepID=UPI002B405898|nr:probable plastidic glucose transporter 2 [Humulus lupulus]